MLSEWSPGCLAGPPRLRALRGRSDHRPLKDSRMKVSSASTIPRSRHGLLTAGARRNRCRQRKAVVGCTPSWPGFCLRSSPGVIEPTLPFVQMRHRRLGQPVEGAPATLAPEPRKPMRASPGDDRSSRAMGTALACHPLMAARSQSIWTATPLRAFVRRPAGRGGLRLSRPPKPAIQIRQGGSHFSALLGAQPTNARKQTEKSSAFIESSSSSPP